MREQRSAAPPILGHLGVLAPGCGNQHRLCGEAIASAARQRRGGAVGNQRKQEAIPVPKEAAGGAQETGSQTGAKDASHLLRMPQEF